MVVPLTLRKQLPDFDEKHKIFEAKRKGIILDNDVDVEAGERRIYARFCPNYDLPAN